MLNGKTIAVAAAVAILSMSSQAGAYTIDLSPSGLQSYDASNTVILSNTVFTSVGESYNAWQWGISCVGCVTMGYTYDTPAGFGGNMNWNNQFLLGLPNPTNNTGSLIQNIAGYGSTWTGANTTFRVGWVTIHVTSAMGSVTPVLENISQGFSLAGVVAPISGAAGATWVPEPGTAMLLALGLSGLGMMGRRNR